MRQLVAHHAAQSRQVGPQVLDRQAHDAVEGAGRPVAEARASAILVAVVQHDLHERLAAAGEVGAETLAELVVGELERVDQQRPYLEQIGAIPA